MCQLKLLTLYKCDLCGKDFSKSGKSYTALQTLKIHIDIVHKGQKIYKCDKCGEKFSKKWDLEKHIKEILNCSKIKNDVFDPFDDFVKKLRNSEGPVKFNR